MFHIRIGRNRASHEPRSGGGNVAQGEAEGETLGRHPLRAGALKGRRERPRPSPRFPAADPRARAFPRPCTARLRWIILALIVAGVARAPLPAQGIWGAGARVYAKNCANVYCHGAKGSAGAAPAVAGKALSPEQVNRIVREGIPDTSMAGWKGTLSAADLASVIEYVVALQKRTASQREELDPNRPWLTHPGRQLFFDAGRIAPCGSCHDFDGLGLAVASPFKAALPLNAAELRTLQSTKVRSVRPAAQEPFIGIAATSRAGVPRWYDLSTELPVLRTFEKAPEDSGPASSWSHGDATETYSDVELANILEFLREALAE